MHVRHVFPDLALLSCPINPTEEKWGDFYVRFAVFIIHIDKLQWIQEHIGDLSAYSCDLDYVWCVTDELLAQLLEEFPYSEAGNSAEGNQIWSYFSKWIESAERTKPWSKRFDIVPDIIPTHVSCKTRTEWKFLVAAASGDEDVVASLSTTEVERLRVQKQGGPFMVDILSPDDWSEILELIDPWFRENLPKQGEFSYAPPEDWRWDRDFPKHHSDNKRYGFRDAEGRIWQWDREEKHWDVQDKRPGRGKYRRVTPDGDVL
jgi:hypothetical protein